jgi:hypothetical protein
MVSTFIDFLNKTIMEYKEKFHDDERAKIAFTQWVK